MQADPHPQAPHTDETNPTAPAPERKSFFNRLPIRWLLAIVAVIVLSAWWLNTPPGLEGKAHAVGYAICHQIYERTFQINGQPISLCARCTGMYVGALVAGIYQLFLGKRRGEWPAKKFLIPLGIFFLAFGFDGFNSAAKLFLGHDLLYTPNNTLRLITGTGMGIVMSVIVLPTFNQTAWRAYDPRPYIETWAQFGGLVGVAAASVLLILTELPIFLLPFSYLGAIGVVIVLTSLYTMILMVILGKENLLERPIDLLPWLLGGLIVAFLHIGGVDIIRYLFTGTWEGFHIQFG